MEKKKLKNYKRISIILSLLILLSSCIKQQEVKETVIEPMQREFLVSEFVNYRLPLSNNIIDEYLAQDNPQTDIFIVFDNNGQERIFTREEFARLKNEN